MSQEAKKPAKADKAASKPKTAAKPKKSKWGLIQWFLIPLLLLIALGGGLAVGYVVFGKQELSDVFHWSTWKHVYDLVFAP